MIETIKSTELSDELVKARREYARKWRQNNKDKIKAYQQRFFEKKAKEYQEQADNNTQED